MTNSAPAKRGVRLALDVGTVRIGVAASDADGIMAFPVSTVLRSVKNVDRTAAAVDEVIAIADERGAATVYVGLPKMLSGSEGTSAADARAFALLVSERTSAVVRLIDERFSTTSATAVLHEVGRTAKQQRSVIDQAAAVVILENALEVERHGTLDTVTEAVPTKGSND